MARENPGRFSYPQPPDFIGSTFLKQVLSELVADRVRAAAAGRRGQLRRRDRAALRLSRRAAPADVARQGRAYPQNYPAMKQLLADNEVDIIFAFNPAEASAAIADGELPDTVRSFIFPGGTLGNTHFVAIPYNAVRQGRRAGDSPIS